VDDGVVELRDADGPESLRVAQRIASHVPGVVGVSQGRAT
jgi:hypothetical protein